MRRCARRGRGLLRGALGLTVLVAGLVAPAVGSAQLPSTPAAAGSSSRHVIVVPEENHSYDAILGSPDAPYLNSLANTFGLATNYTAGVPESSHSLASYLLMTAGTPGVNVNGSDCSPNACPQPGDNIFHQASVAGIGWHGYAESLPTNCDHSGTAGAYAARHLPAPYFTNLTDCLPNDTDLAPLSDDLANGLPAAYNMVTPNLDNDMHDGSVQQGDRWLQTWVPRMLAGKDYQAGNLTIIITFDEGSAASNKLVTVVISPTTSHIKDATPYTHASLLRTVEDMFGLPRLGAAATASSMAAGFHLGSSGTTSTGPSSFAVTGTSHSLYAWRPAVAAFANLAGYLLDPPAVARTADGTTYYLGIGTGSRVFLRTDRIGWLQLMPGQLTCRSPGMAARGQTLYIGCRGTDNALRAMVVGVSGGSVPTYGAVRNLGGVLGSGPGVAPDRRNLGTYYVTSPHPDAAGHNVWRWTAGGWSRLARACASQPAVSHGWYACRGVQGTLKFWRDGDPRVFDAGGLIVGTPGLTASGTGRSATAYVEGTNGCVYTATLSRTAAGPWRCIGGVALGGVGAVGTS